MPGSFTAVGKVGNLPCYLLQGEVGKLRHRRVMAVQGLSSLIGQCPSCVQHCSGLLIRAEQGSPKKSLSQDEGVASRDISFSTEYRQEGTRALLSLKPSKLNFRCLEHLSQRAIWFCHSGDFLQWSLKSAFLPPILGYPLAIFPVPGFPLPWM